MEETGFSSTVQSKGCVNSNLKQKEDLANGKTLSRSSLYRANVFKNNVKLNRKWQQSGKIRGSHSSGFLPQHQTTSCSSSSEDHGQGNEKQSTDFKMITASLNCEVTKKHARSSQMEMESKVPSTLDYEKTQIQQHPHEASRSASSSLLSHHSQYLPTPKIVTFPSSPIADNMDESLSVSAISMVANHHTWGEEGDASSIGTVFGGGGSYSGGDVIFPTFSYVASEAAKSDIATICSGSVVEDLSVMGSESVAGSIHSGASKQKQGRQATTISWKTHNSNNNSAPSSVVDEHPAQPLLTLSNRKQSCDTSNLKPNPVVNFELGTTNNQNNSNGNAGSCSSNVNNGNNNSHNSVDASSILPMGSSSIADSIPSSTAPSVASSDGGSIVAEIADIDIHSIHSTLTKEDQIEDQQQQQQPVSESNRRNGAVRRYHQGRYTHRRFPQNTFGGEPWQAEVPNGDGRLAYQHLQSSSYRRNRNHSLNSRSRSRSRSRERENSSPIGRRRVMYDLQRDRRHRDEVDRW